MRESTFRKFRYLSAHTDHHIVIGIPACGHYVIRNIGQLHQEVVLQLLALFHLRLYLPGVLFHLSHFLLGRLGLILPALLHQGTYLLGLGLLSRESRVQFRLAGTSHPVLFQYFLHYGGCVKILYRKPFDYKLRVIPQKFKSQHLSIIFSGCKLTYKFRISTPI